MDEHERNEKFSNMVMAIRYGYVSAARAAFERALQLAMNHKIEQTLKIIESKGASYLIEDIQSIME